MLIIHYEAYIYLRIYPSEGIRAQVVSCSFSNHNHLPSSSFSMASLAVALLMVELHAGSDMH